jgi:HEAT repeat protein
MTPAENPSAGICLEATMTTLCPACWRVVPHDARRCSHCGADITNLHERDFRDKLMGALTHPIADTVIRAAVALAARHDPEASHAIETAMRRFPNEPHVLAGLLSALVVVADDDARRLALDALGHRSFIVRRTAAQVLEHIGRPASETGCAHREP